MAKRGTEPPIEHGRLLASLAIAPSAAASAKRARHLLWILVYMLMGAVPVILRSGDMLLSGAILGAILIASLIVGMAIARPRL